MRAVRSGLLVVAVMAALVLGPAAGLARGPAWASDGSTILDTLGAATPTTTFSVFGSGGNSFFSNFLVGPRFTLTEPTVVTEIGAFLDLTTGSHPAVVQIRPSVNGLPDPSTVLATATLSSDNDFTMISYELASVRIPLDRGTYFALFSTQAPDDNGFLMNTASDPFPYQAGLTPVGTLDVVTGSVGVSDQFGAFRILGETPNADTQLRELLSVVDGLNLKTSDGLHQQLVAVQNLLSEGKEAMACHTLGAFIKTVEGLSGKSLSSQQATGLVAEAQAIERTIGC